ncbi:hypothetical protein RYZ20_15670 [Thioclava sp. A2]|uniref:hypothetical protein n=1 Tax=Thioclava sp. FCG-A2 TaxID=3080562 RepID=UPI002953D0F9|nr:hypothetical protein [Thioclava sp. A2]MDV7272326.1 hypothetical protein [Thioclava sp. A2]
MSTTAYGIASSLISAIAGPRSVAMKSASEFADLSDNLNSERRINRELRTEVADVSGDLAAERKAKKEIEEKLVKSNADLVSERKTKRELTGQLRGVEADLATSRAAARKAKDSVKRASRKVVARAAKAGARSTSSMAGKLVPGLGTAVIVGATALEAKDLCDTIYDMYELEHLFDPSSKPTEDELTICGWQPPSRQELSDAIAAAPEEALEKGNEVLAYAQEHWPSIDDLRNIEMPDIDWAEKWAQTKSAAGGVASSAADGAGKQLRKLKNWAWGADEKVEAEQ